MAARGNVAKERVGKILREAFGENYIAEQDKKHYVWVDDDGERVQIAISLTCPKTFIEVDGSAIPKAADGGLNFEEDAAPVVKAAPAEHVVEISSEERYNITALMEKLGL